MAEVPVSSFAAVKVKKSMDLQSIEVLESWEFTTYAPLAYTTIFANESSRCLFYLSDYNLSSGFTEIMLVRKDMDSNVETLIQTFSGIRPIANDPSIYTKGDVGDKVLFVCFCRDEPFTSYKNLTLTVNKSDYTVNSKIENLDDLNVSYDIGALDNTGDVKRGTINPGGVEYV